jgi:dihydroneopterin aldolase
VKTLPAALHLNQLRLHVHLGEGSAERAVLQDIDVSVSVYFMDLPAACGDDDGKFICYNKLADVLRAKATSQPYRLIEFLCMQLYAAARGEIVRAMGEDAASIYITLKLNKCHPPVQGLIGGSSFEYTDLPTGLLG